MMNVEKKLYSVTQFNSLAKCGKQYEFRYLKNMPSSKTKDSYLLGDVVGKAIQGYVSLYPSMSEEDRANFSEQYLGSFYIRALNEALVQLGTPYYLIQNYLMGVFINNESPYCEYITSEGHTVSMDRKNVLAQLDMDFIEESAKPSFKWKYTPLSATRKDDRTLEKFSRYFKCVENGITTLANNGMLQGLEVAYPEFKFKHEGQLFDIGGYLDLLLQYSKPNGDPFYRVIEIKTSKPSANALDSSSACPNNAEFIKRDKQCNIYDNWARKEYGEAYKGMFYINTAYQNHLVPFNRDESVWADMVKQLLIADILVKNELFTATCGTGTHNPMAMVCEYAGNCPYVPAIVPVDKSKAKPASKRKAKTKQ